MRVSRYYKKSSGKKIDPRISSFYGKHHDIQITLTPEVSTHVHAPISDSYGASESLSAWRTPDKARDHLQE